MVTGNLPETGQDWSTRSPINYLVNGGFEADSVYPIGWTVQAGATATIVGGKLRINASSADNGVYQELTGLRPDAIYTVVCQVNTGGNEARIITTGSEHNLDEIVKTVQERQWSGLCRASSTGTLTLYLTAHTTGVNIDFDDVCLFRGHLAFPFVPNSVDSWRHPSDSVLIDGGDIYAHSVTAEKVNVVPGNMLANGGFEAGSLVEWTAGEGSPAVQSGNAHSGSYGAQGTGDGVNNLAVLTQSIKVEPSRNYHLSVWVKNGTGTGQAGCYVVWLDKNGGSVGLSSAHDAASTTWAKKSIVAAAPASAATAEFTLTISSDNSATVYFDDCEFYDTDAELLVGIPGGARVQITGSGIQGYKAGPVQTLNVGTDGKFWFGAASGNESIVFDGSTMSLTNVSLSVTDGTFALKSGTSGARVELDTDGFRIYDAASAQNVKLAKDGKFLLKGNDTNYLQWDGTNFTVKGQIYVTGGDAAKTDLSNATANWGKVASPGGNAAASSTAGGAASDAASIASTAANDVVGKVNSGSTLIQPGRIDVIGDWRHPSDITKIDGGDVYTYSITADKLEIREGSGNLLLNSDFSLGSEYWDLLGSSVTTNTPYYGPRCMHITAALNETKYVGQTVSVSSSRQYTVSAYYCSSSGAPGSTNPLAALYVEERNVSGDFLGSFVTNTELNTGFGNYKRLRLTFTTQATTAKLVIYGYVRDHTGSWRWDCFQLERGPYASPWRASTAGGVFIDGGHVLVGTPTAARVEINNAGIEGYSDASTKQFYLRTTDGRAMFGGGKGVLDATGVVLSGNETSYNTFNAIRWMTAVDPPGGNMIARVLAGRWTVPSSYPGLLLEANPGLSYTDAAATLAARSSTSADAQVHLGVASNSATAWLTAKTTNYQTYLKLATSGNRLTLTAELTDILTVDASGNLTSSGQVNMIHPNIVLPVELLASVTLTGSYQNVVWQIQTWNDVFTAIAGRSYTSQTGWEMWWVVPCRFQTNPTTIRAALYHYTGGSWQYHATTYTKQTYAGGINYIAWGPWTLSKVSQTMELHLRLDSGTGKSVGPNEGGTSYLVFRRS